MTIEWHYRAEENFGVLAVAGFLGPDAVGRFAGAVGWALTRGRGTVIVDLSELRSWSIEGQQALTAAAVRLAAAGRSLELAAIPADGSLVPDGSCPPIPVHTDIASALAAHQPGTNEHAQGRQQWRTDGWPSRR